MLTEPRRLRREVLREEAWGEERRQGPEGEPAASDGDGVSAGTALAGAKAHPGVVQRLKALCLHERYHVTELWDDNVGRRVTSSSGIGRCLREDTRERQGRSRGDSALLSQMLQGRDLDLRNARIALSESETLDAPLALPEHKAPGTSGVRGRLYKLRADELSTAFVKAFHDLTQGEREAPSRMTDVLRHANPKKHSADATATLRDLELPNEDAKILGRMLCRNLDQAAAAQLRRRQQAFVAGGRIERNIVEIAEAIRTDGGDMTAFKFVLFLGCSKGFNLFLGSWSTPLSFTRASRRSC